MPLPTQQPLNWVQRLAAKIFRIDTRQEIIHKAPVYIKGGSPVQFSVVTEPITSREWRPGDQMPAPPPRVVGRAPQPGMTQMHLRGADPQSLYDFVASKTDWQLIISAGDWYNIARSKSEGRRKPYQLQIFDRKRGRNKQIIASKFFATPNEASDFAMQLINIHLTKHY
jgi:hypothetical protein